MTRMVGVYLMAALGVTAGLATDPARAEAPQPQREARCVTEAYPPYAAPGLPSQGVTWELVEKAFASQGVQARLEFVTWARAMEETRNGNSDCLIAAFRTREREGWFLYSKQLGEVRTGLFRRRDRTDIVFTGDMAQLRPWKIGVGRGYANSEAFDAATDLQKLPLESSEQGLRMLFLGRLDLVAGAETVDGHTLKHKLEPANPGMMAALEFIEPPLQVQPFYVALPKNKSGQDLLESLNAGIDQLKANGEWQRIVERHRSD